MDIFSDSFNPYGKIVDDKALRKSTISYASINSAVVTRDPKQNELIDEKINELQDAFEALDELQHEDKKELVKVYFTNITGNKITQIALSKEAVIFLNKEFGSVHQRKDGSFLLDGESNAYVWGWYNEIAQNQNYLQADTNKDGLIDDEEKLNLKSLFIPNRLCYGGMFLSAHDMKTHRNFSALRLDRDFNGFIKYTDYDKNIYHNFIKDLLNELIKDNPLLGLSKEDFDQFLEQYKEKIKQELAKRNEEKLKIFQDKDDKEKIYTKLLSSTDLSTLSIEEKNLAKKYFPKLVQMLENKQNVQDFNHLFQELLILCYANSNI